MQVSLRHAATILFCLAFIAKAVIPQGFMPELSQLIKGNLRLVICTGMGLQAITVDGKLHKVDSQQPVHDGKGGDSCPFGGLVFAAPVYGAMAVTILSFIFLRLISRRKTGLSAMRHNDNARSRAPPYAITA